LKTKSYILLILFFALLLVSFPLRFSRFTANNDLYIQLLAADGLLSGHGYGYFEGETFHPVGDRFAPTKFPPGMSFLAALIKWAGGDPLVYLVSLYPILILTSFAIFWRALSKEEEMLSSIILSFAALTPLSVLQTQLELTTEPFALVFAALLFAQIVQEPRLNSLYDYFRAGLKLIILAWILTMIRNAMLLLCIGALLAYTLLWVRGLWKKLGFLVITGVFLIMPQAIFRATTIQSTAQISLPASQITAGPVANFLKELNSDVSVLAETVIPRLLSMDRHREVMSALGWLVFAISVGLSFLFLFYRSRKERNTPEKSYFRITPAAFASVVISAVYIALLAVTSSVFQFAYSEVYRVQGFILPWMVIGFWSSLSTLSSAKNLGRLILIIALLTAFGRFAYACYYEKTYAGQREFFQDYWETSDDVKKTITENFRSAQRVTIYTGGHSTGRNIFRLLLYSDSNHARLPWRIESLDQEDWPITNPESLGGKIPCSVLLVVNTDLEDGKHFSFLRTGMKHDCLKNAQGKDFSLFGSCDCRK
jgi:hypothetical protein